MVSSAPTREVDRDTLVRYLDQYLEVDRGTDYCPNGLQVEGRSRISRIVTGVSGCLDLFQIARQKEADAVLVHHGLFWRGDPAPLTGVQYQRIAELIRGEMSLIAYHLPLDRHLEVGNNAVAARIMGLSEVSPFCDHEGLPLGVQGRFSKPMTRDRALAALAEMFGQEPRVFAYGTDEIRSIAFVSGAGGRCFQAAIAEELDLFVTGEAEEWTMNLAKETATNFAAAGHYATERLGVQALGDKIHQDFSIDVEFVDLPNPI